MVLQTRLDYGFNGYQVPPTPRATRSVRRKRNSRSKSDENQMCAFELLATEAGKLLLEGDSADSSTDTSYHKEQSASLKGFIKNQQYNIHKPIDTESPDQGIYSKSFVVSELVAQVPFLDNCSKEPPHVKSDACSGPASVITTSECSVKVDSPEQLVCDESKVMLGIAELPDTKVSVSCKLDGEHKTQIEVESLNNGKASVRHIADMCNSDCPVTGNNNLSALVSSHHSVQLLLGKSHSSCGSPPVNSVNVKLGTRDDDENSGCTKPSTENKAVSPFPCNEDQGIMMLKASDSWKVNSTVKDDEQCHTDIRQVCHGRKSGYKRQRSLKDYPFKKRKHYDCNSISNPNGGFNGDGFRGSPGKGSYGEAPDSAGTSTGVAAPLTSAAVGCGSLPTGDSHVKLKIKSFRIPELLIEIPETATVGSLKRTVMEAVTAILGGGLHVGVLLQGKKIRDDNRTLLQTGITHNNKMDVLGFTLEPNSCQAPLPLCSEGHSFLVPNDARRPLTRYLADPILVDNVVQHGTSDTSTDRPGTNFSNFAESDHDSASSPPDMSQEKSAADSRALVAAPSVNAQALNMVPTQKPKQSESAQRRIRRPFSVSEVEALVQAVEKLGTGRWRDVKLRAFDNAKHRTYVDLKDKWKTLVHTAKISPQQRRGSPVPQELLDRVLMAHSYWSQQQAKQHFEHHSEACLLL